MMDWISGLTILADEAAKPEPQSPLGAMLFPMLIIGFLWYFLLMRPQRKEQQRRQDLLGALKKNDKVVTIGGITGTVFSISPDGKYVTIKVDDNAKLKMLRSSIQGLLEEDTKKDETPAASEE